MGICKFACGAALALSLAGVRGAAAQEPAGALVLPEVVVSATGVPTAAAEVGSSVTVITAAEIERRHIQTVPELLQLVPGLHVVQQGSPGAQTSVFMRGTNSNAVKVLADVDAVDEHLHSV